MDLNITRWSKLKYKVARFKHYENKIHEIKIPETEEKKEVEI